RSAQGSQEHGRLGARNHDAESTDLDLAPVAHRMPQDFDQRVLDLAWLPRIVAGRAQRRGESQPVIDGLEQERAAIGRLRGPIQLEDDWLLAPPWKPDSLFPFASHSAAPERSRKRRENRRLHYARHGESLRFRESSGLGDPPPRTVTPPLRIP